MVARKERSIGSRQVPVPRKRAYAPSICPFPHRELRYSSVRVGCFKNLVRDGETLKLLCAASVEDGMTNGCLFLSQYPYEGVCLGGQTPNGPFSTRLFPLPPSKWCLSVKDCHIEGKPDCEGFALARTLFVEMSNFAGGVHVALQNWLLPSPLFAPHVSALLSQSCQTGPGPAQWARKADAKGQVCWITNHLDYEMSSETCLFPWEVKQWHFEKLKCLWIITSMGGLKSL